MSTYTFTEPEFDMWNDINFPRVGVHPLPIMSAVRYENGGCVALVVGRECRDIFGPPHYDILYANGDIICGVDGEQLVPSKLGEPFVERREMIDTCAISFRIMNGETMQMISNAEGIPMRKLAEVMQYPHLVFLRRKYFNAVTEAAMRAVTQAE